MDSILEKVKTALRVTTSAFDDEISDMISACLLDLGIAGVTETDTTNALLIRAICTYCKFHFGDVGTAERTEIIKKSYDEQKAQLMMASGYTNFDEK